MKVHEANFDVHSLVEEFEEELAQPVQETSERLERAVERLQRLMKQLYH
jgi:hypothetical protein